MPVTPNSLSEMARLKGNAICEDERPNETFPQTSFPAFGKLFGSVWVLFRYFGFMPLGWQTILNRTKPE